MAWFERSRLTVVATVSALAAGLGMVGAVAPVRRRDVEPATFTERALAAGIGAALAVTVVALAAVIARRTSLAPRVRRRGVVGVAALAAAVIGGLVAVDSTNTSAEPTAVVSDDPSFEVAPDADAAGTRSRILPEDRDDRLASLDVGPGGITVLFLGLALLIGAIVMFARRREARMVGREGVYLLSDLDPDEGDEADEEELAEALRATRRQLDRAGSPAERILAAYATLLDELALIGLARRRSEPPGAYARRCLNSKPLPTEPVITLLELFELARFSEVQLDERDVAQAGDALDAVLAHLEVLAR